LPVFKPNGKKVSKKNNLSVETKHRKQSANKIQGFDQAKMNVQYLN
jgi:hypothetical protein